MRNFLINKIWELIKKDKNVYLLTADLGYWVLNELLDKYPEQCINVWIAEQNMIWIASGLALSWKKVFCYSIVPFITMRCYEQIRIDICSHNLDITLIWVWWWFAYWTLWNTHYWIEDINIMNWLPNMQIYSPADSIEIESLFNLLINKKSPKYIRLNRWGENNIYNKKINETEIKNWIKIFDWKDLIIFTTGQITLSVKETIEELKINNYSIKLVSIPFLKPINKNAIKNHINWISKVITIEEHSIIWWLWSNIADIIAEHNLNVQFKKIWIKDQFFYKAWNQDYMRKLAWIDRQSITNEIKNILN